MDDDTKTLDRGIKLSNKEQITYKLPAYLPNISNYVYCTKDDIWIHASDVKMYVKKEGGLYLEDKAIIVDKYVYELEHNLESEEQGRDVIDLQNIYKSIPRDIFGIIVGFVVGNSTKMFYRMCLVSKEIKQITQKYTDYTYLMSKCGIGRMDLEDISLNDIDERVIIGILCSGNFSILQIICSDRAINLIYKLLDEKEGKPPIKLIKELNEQIRCIKITSKSHIILRELKQKIRSIPFP